MVDFLYVGVGMMVFIKGGIFIGMIYYMQEQSIDCFMQIIFVFGNIVFDDMVMLFQEVCEVLCMFEELVDKFEKKIVKDFELIQELCCVMNKIYVVCMMIY